MFAPETALIPQFEVIVPKATERYVAFGFGVFFVIVLLILAIKFPEPSPFQYNVFRIVLALAAGGIAAMISGFLTVSVGNWVRAGGALAVFFIVYFYSPAKLTGVEVQTEKEIDIEKPLIASSVDTRMPLPNLTVSTPDQLNAPGVLDLRYGSIRIAGVEAKLPAKATLVANEISGSNGGSLRGQDVIIVAQKLSNLTVNVAGPEHPPQAGSVSLYAKLIENIKVLANGSNGQKGADGGIGADGVKGADGRNGDCGCCGAYKGAQVGAPGGDAGNGQNGSPGGDGQAGGRITVTTIVSPVASQFNADGGDGDLGGNGGSPGNPGHGGIGGTGCTGLGGTQPSQGNGHDGNTGQPGKTGPHGKAGKTGVYDVKIVNTFDGIVRTLKANNNFQLSAALSQL